MGSRPRDALRSFLKCQKSSSHRRREGLNINEGRQERAPYCSKSPHHSSERRINRRTEENEIFRKIESQTTQNAVSEAISWRRANLAPPLVTLLSSLLHWLSSGRCGGYHYKNTRGKYGCTQ